MKLIPLPASSPPLNPVEQVWDEGRGKWFATQGFGSMDALEQQWVRA